jgi:diguanylate cyclase (GGDEF)-like protein/PAS domain S-box-containing protein
LREILPFVGYDGKNTGDKTPMKMVTEGHQSPFMDQDLLQTALEVQAIFQQDSIGIALMRDRALVRCNQAFADIFGYPHEALAGVPGDIFFQSKNDYVEFWSHASAILATGQPFRVERHFSRQDGSLVLCAASASAVDSQHPEWGTIWLMEDVTVERQQQAELQAALLRLEAIKKNAPLGIIQTVDRQITDCNAHFNAMFGFEPDEAVGMMAVELLPSPQDYAALGQMAGPLLSNAQPVDIELRMRRQSGEVFWVQLVGYVLDPTHTSAGTIWLITDRTESREQAESLQLALLENQAILDGAALGMVVLRERVVLRCNPQFETLFGYAPGTMQGMSIRPLYQNESDFEWIGTNLYPQLASGGAVTHEVSVKCSDGSLFWVHMSGRQLGAGSPMSGATLWLYEDISENRSIEEALQTAHVLNHAVCESAGAALIATDTQGIIQLFNTAAERMLGYTAQELQFLQTPALLHDPAEVVAYAEQLTLELGEVLEPGFDLFCIKARLNGKDEQEWTYIGKSGQRIPVLLCVTALRAASGEISGYLGMATDITERHKARQATELAQLELEDKVRQRTAELAESNVRLQAEVTERADIERQMRELAHFDPVTSLPNRNLLLDRMRQALLQAQRNGEHVAVMFLDLDRFKNINDTLGHQVGDALLRQVAVRLSMALRTTDTLARIGGDEFVLILPGLDAASHVEGVADKLISALQAPMAVQEHALHITTSIGICIYQQDGADTDVLLRNADTAMYQAKAAGRNTFRFFTETMNQEADRHYRIESALRTGVRDNELRLLYQPLVDMRSNRIFGVEALVRGQSPTLGLVPPIQFIGIAEETDLIVQIDSWVFRTACEQAAQWRRQGFDDLTLAVNLSARQFRRKDLVEFIAGVLAQTGYPAHLLELEITESALMHNVSEVIQTLDRLVALGVHLAIDDFGTGYSSLAYLKRFPMRKLKIDQSFVRDIGKADSDLGIVKTVIALAQTLRLDLLAEGVETQAHLMTLRALGCDRFQGYLFSKPVMAEQIEHMLGTPATQLLVQTV